MADGLSKTFNIYTDVTEFPDHGDSKFPLMVHSFGHSVDWHDEDVDVRVECVHCWTHNLMVDVSYVIIGGHSETYFTLENTNADTIYVYHVSSLARTSYIWRKDKDPSPVTNG